VTHLLKLAVGLRFLHSGDKMYIHRDIKMGNIFIFKEGYKIGDFGTVVKVTKKDKMNNLRAKSCFGAEYMCTPDYLPPEIKIKDVERNEQNKKKIISYDEKVDI